MFVSGWKGKEGSFTDPKTEAPPDLLRAGQRGELPGHGVGNLLGERGSLSQLPSLSVLTSLPLLAQGFLLPWRREGLGRWGSQRELECRCALSLGTNDTPSFNSPSQIPQSMRCGSSHWAQTLSPLPPLPED